MKSASSNVPPFPDLSPDQEAELAALARRAWSIKRGLDTVTETSHAFTLPALLADLGYAGGRRQRDYHRDTEILCRTVPPRLPRQPRHREARPCPPHSHLCVSVSLWSTLFLFPFLARPRRRLDPPRRRLRNRVGGHPGRDRRPGLRALRHQWRGPPRRRGLRCQSTAGRSGGRRGGRRRRGRGGRLVGRAGGAGAVLGDGGAIGRFDLGLAVGERPLPPEPDPFDPLPARSPAMAAEPAGDGYWSTTRGTRTTSFGPCAGCSTPSSARMAISAWTRPSSWSAPPIRGFGCAASSSPGTSSAIPRAGARRRCCGSRRCRRDASLVWLWIHRATADTLHRINAELVEPKIS